MNWMRLGTLVHIAIDVQLKVLDKLDTQPLDLGTMIAYCVSRALVIPGGSN